jgi:hypothetical protein
LSPTDVSTSPETTKTSPFPRTVAVGYQRPAFILGKNVHESVAGSYVLAWDNPTLF